MPTANPNKTFNETVNIPASPPTISVAGLAEDTAPYTIPPAPLEPDYTSTVASIPEILSAQAPTETEKTQGTLSSRILEMVGKFGGRQEAQANAEDKANLPVLNQQLTDLSGQLQSLQKEALAIPLQLQEEATGRGVTTGGLQPIQTGLLRQNAIKSLTLSALAQTVQGNIALAKQQADRAVDLEFAPIEASLNFLTKAYELNRDQLEREDKKRAQEIQIKLEERSRVLNLMREDRKFTTDIALQAAQFGAPQDIIERMRNTTPDEAIKIGSYYLGAEFRAKAEQQAFERNIALRQIANQEANSALDRKLKLLELAKAGDSSAITQLGYDPANLPGEALKREEQKIAMQRDIDIAKRARTNGVGLQKSAGLIRGGVIGAFFESPGGILGAPYGAAKKNDFLADAGYIVKNMTFNKIRELADMGVKLTPISEKELKAMADASSVLAASAQYDGNGNLTGFKIGEGRVREQLQLIEDHYQRALDQIAVESNLDKDDLAEINSL